MANRLALLVVAAIGVAFGALLGLLCAHCPDSPRQDEIRRLTGAWATRAPHGISIDTLWLRSDHTCLMRMRTRRPSAKAEWRGTWRVHGAILELSLYEDRGQAIAGGPWRRFFEIRADNTLRAPWWHPLRGLEATFHFVGPDIPEKKSD